MAFALFLTRPAEGDTLIEGHVVADDRRFSDDDAHAMVDEQAFADLGAGMDLDAREEAGNRGNEAGRDEPLMLIEEVGQAMGPDGMKAGIAEQDFQRVLGGCIAWRSAILCRKKVNKKRPAVIQRRWSVVPL